MHETVIAQSLHEIIMQEAKKQNAKPVSAKITCSVFDAVNDETLSFALDCIAKDTICQGLKLEIEHKPIQAKCCDCKKIFDLDLTGPKCHNCGGSFELLPQDPLLLESIEFDTE